MIIICYKEKMKKTKFELICLAAITVGLVSCGNTHTEKSGLSILTSFYPVYDFTMRILKNHGTVTNITPAGSEPHDYELTSSDVKKMETADAVFVNGLNLEPWFASLPSDLSAKTSTITNGIKTREVEGAIDPHVWLNPLNAIHELTAIKDKLVALDPQNAGDYETNWSDAVTLFQAIDAKFEAIASSFSNKYIVVSHAAFGYLADRYGLTQIYIDGLSPDDEPSPEDIAKIIDTVKKYDISTIFYEDLVSPAISKKIAAETGVMAESLNPLEGLTSEQLETEDYVSVMIDDFRKLKVACR